MNESKREFLGITPASITSAVGFLAGTIPYALPPNVQVSTLVRLIFSAISLLLIIAGIVMNWKKGFAIVWRRVNLIIQLTMFAIVAAIAVFFNFMNR